jgi:hypothetical protein
MRLARIKRLLAVICFAAVFAAPSALSQKISAGNFDGLKFLEGDWVGDGSGEPGQGTGGFSFHLDLQGKILVRKSYAEYPATKDKPAYRHDDLMVFYYDDASAGMRADYFDNEGHTIHYRVQVAADGKSCSMVSDPIPNTPTYRLSYSEVEPGRVKLKFEIAPPGDPPQFKTYIDASARRSASQ